MLKELGEVIRINRSAARGQAGPDGAPPKWWRDLLAAYTTLVSYTPFDKWEGYLHVIDEQYKISDARVYCYNSGDRGGWVIDSGFSKKHVIFFAMGTNTPDQMDANTAYLPYFANLETIIEKYNEKWDKPWLPQFEYEGRFCPALASFENPKQDGYDWAANYIFKENRLKLFPSIFSKVTISLGALRGIRAACLYPKRPLNGRNEGFYNPMLDFFKDIQDAHVTFAGHSRGGIAEGLAAFVSVHNAGQKILSLRVVGLATPAASNLWQYSSQSLPNGKEFSRIAIQNQSSDLAGIGADQIPRMGSEGGKLALQQWTTGFGFGLWNVNYGQQRVSYLYDWSTNISSKKSPPEPSHPIIRRRAGNTSYLINAVVGIGNSWNFTALALPHWAGVYAAGIIGQYYWNNNRASYWKFLSKLSEEQEKSLKNIRFNTVISGPGFSTREPLTEEQFKDDHFVRKAFLYTDFRDSIDKPNGPIDKAGDLWTFFYMSEAALAATQNTPVRILPDRFLPGSTRYSEGNDIHNFFFVHIRNALEFCKNGGAPNCERWQGN